MCERSSAKVKMQKKSPMKLWKRTVVQTRSQVRRKMDMKRFSSKWVLSQSIDA